MTRRHSYPGASRGLLLFLVMLMLPDRVHAGSPPPAEGRAAPLDARPSVEMTVGYRFAVAPVDRAGDEGVVWQPGHGYSLLVTLQPMLFLERRITISLGSSFVFFDDDVVGCVDGGVGYQHHFDDIDVYGRLFVGTDFVSDRRVNAGAEGGAKFYFHPAFHLYADIGGSIATPFYLSAGIGSDARYLGPAVAGVAAVVLIVLLTSTDGGIGGSNP